MNKCVPQGALYDPLEVVHNHMLSNVTESRSNKLVIIAATSIGVALDELVVSTSNLNLELRT